LLKKVNSPIFQTDALTFGVVVIGHKKSPLISLGAFVMKKRQRLTLPHVIAVPSALAGLTSLFGMGRGEPHRYSHLNALQVFVFKGCRLKSC
jgi:hypothetical protein